MKHDTPPAADDVATLHAMGYAQELSRTMGRFSNFAISFSVICILSGGINSLAQATSGAGGGSIGLGWLIGGACTLLFSLGMAQIASAYPTAGGLYHWSSILGGRFWGWMTALFNLIGLITVLAAVNVGTFSFFVGAFGPALGIQAGPAPQFIFMILVTGAQAILNHLGIKLTSRLTDLSGYLIPVGVVFLTGVLLAYAPSHHVSRLWTFTNYSVRAGRRRVAQDRVVRVRVSAQPAAAALHPDRRRRPQPTRPKKPMTRPGTCRAASSVRCSGPPPPPGFSLAPCDRHPRHGQAANRGGTSSSG